MEGGRGRLFSVSALHCGPLVRRHRALVPSHAHALAPAPDLAPYPGRAPYPDPDPSPSPDPFHALFPDWLRECGGSAAHLDPDCDLERSTQQPTHVIITTIITQQPTHIIICIIIIITTNNQHILLFLLTNNRYYYYPTTNTHFFS